ncbi:MAG TPA: DNA repair protein RecN [Rhodocyclaceae bacterium]
MLKQLTIRDFVLVDRLELPFESGFGVLTGETGAGKSILVDALAFVLGERADTGLIRAGAERAEVSAEFEVAGNDMVRRVLADQELGDEDGVLLLRRVVDAGGRSRAWLNGTPVTLQQLREITDLLVDIHGQHAHQSLLRADAQRDLLDAYGDLVELAAEVADTYRRWRDAQAHWQASLTDGEALRRQRESLAWEVDELRALAFSPDEWQSLNAEQAKLANAVALLEGSTYCVQALGEAEYSCSSQLSAVAARLDELAAYDASLAELGALVRSAEAEVGEALAGLRRYGERVDLDPSRLAEVDQRLEAILGTARKFRIQANDLGDALVERERQLAALGDAANPEKLAEASRAAEARFRTLAERLGAARRTVATQLGKEVSAQMGTLAFGGGSFEVTLTPVEEGGSFGLERVEFRVGGLAGSEMKPLARVASGGELSRISLALQVVASRAAKVPTLVFDEVDVGIGGGVAEVVGRLMRSLGRNRQVLCVTHLPQVAACADWQWRVSKARRGDAFVSAVERLSAASREEEIARMLGGVEITPVSRQHAREMLAVVDAID